MPLTERASRADAVRDAICLAQLRELLPGLDDEARCRAAERVRPVLASLPAPNGWGVRAGGRVTVAVLTLACAGSFATASPQAQARSLRRVSRLPLVGDFLRVSQSLAVVEALEAER
ncbi:MAG: hypothetical protein WAW88_14600 [Nocardioides sp.]